MNKTDETRIDETGAVRRKKKHVFPIILIIILLVLIAGLAGVYFYLKKTMPAGTHVDVSGLNEGAAVPEGFQTIALYGVDSDDGELEEGNHSDAIIVVAFDQNEGVIRMVSVHRDTCLDNTKGELGTASSCYFAGGPEQSINMLNENLDLNITDYVALDFDALVAACDLMGGVDMEITDEEMTYINEYCEEACAAKGEAYTPLTESGMVHLDGMQATSFCRNRYTQGLDFSRTNRQREVFMTILQKARGANPLTMLSIVKAMLPMIATSYESAELVSVISQLIKATIVDQSSFPFETADAAVNGTEAVVPVTLASNTSSLHQFLYLTEGYEPSETVKRISSEISENTGIY